MSHDHHHNPRPELRHNDQRRHMDHYQRSARNVFSACVIDRQTEQRSDRTSLHSMASAAQSRFLPIHERCCLLHVNSPRLLLLPQADTTPSCYLGLYNTQPLFAVNVSDADLADRYAAEQHGRWVDLRSACGCVAAPEAGIAAYAIAMLNWQHRHRYCGDCGHPNVMRDGGHRMRCSNEACARETFPRIDPAMIVLIEHGDAILLGRQANWPARRYSTLAGFVEPGESIEDAVRREVMEEAGIELEQMFYHSSQPWPFPGSLMIGFRATALTTSIRCGAELADARWWTLADFERSIRTQELLLSMPQSIAFALISDWYAEHTGKALADVVRAA